MSDRLKNRIDKLYDLDVSPLINWHRLVGTVHEVALGSYRRIEGTVQRLQTGKVITSVNGTEQDGGWWSLAEGGTLLSSPTQLPIPFPVNRDWKTLAGIAERCCYLDAKRNLFVFTNDDGSVITLGSKDPFNHLTLDELERKAKEG